MYEKQAKTQVYEKKPKFPTTNVDRRNNKPQMKFTRLTNTIDNILNVLLKELIELPPVVQHHFPNGVP